MSNENNDRFKRVDRAIERVRTELDEVIDESKDVGAEAREDVREAIDDVEARNRQTPKTYRRIIHRPIVYGTFTARKRPRRDPG